MTNVRHLSKKPAAHTAADEYAFKMDEIHTQVARIIDGIADHKVRHLRDSTNWGLAGDLATILAKLSDVADSLNRTGEYAA